MSDGSGVAQNFGFSSFLFSGFRLYELVEELTC